VAVAAVVASTVASAVASVVGVASWLGGAARADIARTNDKIKAKRVSKLTALIVFFIIFSSI
jgi:hypothetical protein